MAFSRENGINDSVNWGAFNPNNLKGEYLDNLRNDIYAGFRTKTQTMPDRRWGRGQGNTKQVFDASYYRDHQGWGAIGEKLGLKKINSENDVRQMFDYVNNYKPPAPKAAPAPPKAAAIQRSPLKTSSVYKQPAQVSNYNAANDARATKYQNDINALKASNAARNSQYTNQINQLKSQFNTQSGNFQNLQSMYAGQVNKYNQSQQNWNKQFANQQSAFDTKYGNLTNQFNASVQKYDGMIDDLKIQNSTNLSNLNASFRASMKPVSQGTVGIKTKKSKANATGASSKGTRQLSRNPLSISNINL